LEKKKTSPFAQQASQPALSPRVYTSTGEQSKKSRLKEQRELGKGEKNYRGAKNNNNRRGSRKKKKKERACKTGTGTRLQEEKGRNPKKTEETSVKKRLRTALPEKEQKSQSWIRGVSNWKAGGNRRGPQWFSRSLPGGQKLPDRGGSGAIPA